MNLLRSLFCTLRAPDDGSGGGGGGGDAGAGVDTGHESHSSEADLVFAGESGADAGAEAGGDKDASAKAASDKAAAEKTAAEKGAAAKAKSPSVFGKIGAKKTDDAAAAAAAKAQADKGAAATADEDKINLSDKAAPETKTQFGELKKITKTLRSELAARDARIADLEKRASSAALPPEVEKLRAEHKALSDRLAIVDLQNHPDYVRQFVEPKNKLVGSLNGILSENGAVGSDVAAIMGKPRAEFMKAAADLAAKLPEYERATFMSDMRQLHSLDAQSKDALKQAGEVGSALQQKTADQQRAAFDETWKTLNAGAEDGLQPLEIPDGIEAEERAQLEAYNKGLAEIRTNAEKIAFGRMDEKGVALNATKAAGYDFMLQHAVPRMEAEFKRAADLIQQLTAEITALKGARGSGSGDAGGGNDAATDETHEAAAAKAFRR